MLYWDLYNGVGHSPDIRGKRKYYDNNIYTFDIETSSYYILDGEVYPAITYDKLSEKDKNRCIKRSHMYIWMFGINDIVYYGRTWDELKLFLKRLDDHINDRKYVFIHNLAFEFQYLKSNFHFDEVSARKSHKVITAIMKDYNIMLKCSYMMSNVGLKYLPKMFDLPVEKKVGDLDYSLIRNPNTPMSEKELGYCEYDCLVLYHYILKELDVYEDVKHIPTTNTGKVRRELQDLTRTNFKYRRVVNKAINTNPIIYNRLCEAFLGGYTHANWIYADEVLHNVDSYDIASSYPYVLVTQKYPNSEFRPCKIKKREEMSRRLAYLLVVKFKNVKCKYYNNFISASKCREIRGAKYDNGRIIEALELEMTLTDIDFKYLFKFYNFDYKITRCIKSKSGRMPKYFIKVLVDLYDTKNRLKPLYEKDASLKAEYLNAKGLLNSVYGMCVYKDKPVNYTYDGTKWNVELNEDYHKFNKQSLLMFQWGVWTSAFSRAMLYDGILICGEDIIYSDTDSCKFLNKENHINDFNKWNLAIDKKVRTACAYYGIDFNIMRGLGRFDFESDVEIFKTLGAKRYIHDGHITISGISDKAYCDYAKMIDKKPIDCFYDGFKIPKEYTGKNTSKYYINNVKPYIYKYEYNGRKYKLPLINYIYMCNAPWSMSLSKDYRNLLIFLHNVSRETLESEV